MPEPGEQRSAPRLRSTLFRRRDAAEQPETVAEVAEEEVLALEAELENDTSEIGQGEAETIDLSDVRRARELALADSSEHSGGGVRGALARFRSEREEDPVRQAEQRVRDAKKERRGQEKRESKRFSADARRRRRNWLIALGTVAALALFVAVGVFTPLMSVRQVQLVGASSVNAAEVEDALARFDGVPLALVQESEIHDALQPFPFIQRYAFELIPPDTLMVRIVERVPVLTIEQDGMFNSYDAAGVWLVSAETPLEGVPLASGAVTDLSSEAFSAASRVLRDMPAEMRAQIASVEASSGQDVTTVFNTGLEVLWGDAEDTQRKVVVLTAMISSLADRAISNIDVSSPRAPVFH